MIIQTSHSKVILTHDLQSDLSDCLKGVKPEKIFVLTDENTYRYCAPLIKELNAIRPDAFITIKAGDTYKNIEALSSVWSFLTNHGADRHSILINLGGGMVTDLGGFAASTFKRGLRFINIPTTLLSMVDAAVGGKTGINFEGFKNEIGVINHAEAVLVHPPLLESLDNENICSGYAEMIKHALIYSAQEWETINQYDLQKRDMTQLAKLIGQSISIKEHFVSQDPYERGIRKALNFGHTIGHAFESWAMNQKRPILHGYAVAFGMVGELFLSHLKYQFPIEIVEEVKEYIHQYYGKFDFTSQSDDLLYELMTHDKKNTENRINFSLLSAIGEVKINTHCSLEEVKKAFDFYRS